MRFWTHVFLNTLNLYPGPNPVLTVLQVLGKMWGTWGRAAVPPGPNRISRCRVALCLEPFTDRYHLFTVDEEGAEGSVFP